MPDRRQILASSAAVAALATMGSSDPNPIAATKDDAALDAALQALSQAMLQASPEMATRLGLDVGTEADLRSRLDDRSAAGKEKARRQAIDALQQLRSFDRARLSAGGRLNLEVALFVFSTLAEGLGRYGFIDLDLRPSPYVVSQMNGAYYWLPDFIGSKPPLQTRSDVEAWYARLAALAVVLDQETARIDADAAQGVAPPGFVIDRTLAQLARLRDAPPGVSALIGPAVARARSAGLGDLGLRAEVIFRGEIAPALSRQIAALQALRPSASGDAGVWRLPDGEAYYAAALLANTTVDTPAHALHLQGRAQVDQLLAQIDQVLRAQGLSQGTVGERLGALNGDPRFRVSDDDAGRAVLLATARRLLDDATRRLPRVFNDPRVDPVVVLRTPEAVEAGSPSAFYEEGAPGQPGAFMLNLARPQDLALWRLPTLAHHEGVPGHHFQFGVMRHSKALPLFRRMLQFSSYTEGWALYAEQLADEIGCYEDDPFGRIGYLQSELFRAARIVVDTGLHHERWTRDQAVAWMVTTIGETATTTAREIDRYCVYPGQACSFKVGANTILASREAARSRLGARFDIRAFHDRVLGSGPVPMSVLQSDVAQWSTA